ncbi:MAG: NADH-quinone oxidoreductase subunit L [Chloroflexota bacterium]|jgi:NADH-quinone oxidoreductase subunit L
MALTWLILTIGLPWLGALLIWLLGDRLEKRTHALAVLFSVAAGIAALLLLPYGKERLVFFIPIGGAFGDFTFVLDGLGVFLAAIATVVGSLAVIFSADYMRHEAQLARYYAFVLFFIGSMVGLVLTSNLLLMFFFWEITALCSYALISFHNDDPKAVAGGIKALIITQLGGVGLLAGALLLYAYTGSYDLQAFIANPGILPAGVLAWMGFGCLVAAAAKSAQFPFQTWLPDAMEAPTPISALIHAATMVNAGVYLLARFYPAFEGVAGWREAVMICGVLSALMAAVMAIVATDLKRVLAYSTVSQLGYMVYAVGAGDVFSSQFHLLSHSVFKALLFLGAGAVIHAVGTRDMRQMGGLGKNMPLVRAVFVIGSLALAGIPIFNGFWSKEMILEAGLHDNPIWLYVLMVMVAGLTAFYTVRMVTMVFYGPARAEHHHAHDAGPMMKIALVPLAAGTMTTWLLVSSFGQLLAVSLPAHGIKAYSILAVLEKVFTAPATYAALAVVGLGLFAGFRRERLSAAGQALGGIAQAAADSFGFEAINRAVALATQRLAEGLRVTQPGLLNWNVFAILLALIVLLASVGLGGR